MNWLTDEINQHLSSGYTILDLCCGNGGVADGFKFKTYIGVDIVPKYLEMSTMNNLPNVTLICSDVLEFCKNNTENFDVVMAIDALEHLLYEDSVELVEYLEQFATKKIIFFTPENTIDAPTCNDVSNTWGVSDGDHYQKHVSMFKRKFFKDRGYQVKQLYAGTNCFTNIPYYEMLYVLTK